jgi:hypothetical protein
MHEIDAIEAAIVEDVGDIDGIASQYPACESADAGVDVVDSDVVSVRHEANDVSFVGVVIVGVADLHLCCFRGVDRMLRASGGCMVLVG